LIEQKLPEGEELLILRVFARYDKKVQVHSARVSAYLCAEGKPLVNSGRTCKP